MGGGSGVIELSGTQRKTHHASMEKNEMNDMSSVSAEGTVVIADDETSGYHRALRPELKGFV